jgi:Na+/proline symporter
MIHLISGVWAWVIFGVTAVFMFWMSYWIYRRTKVETAEEFMVANRGVPWGLIAASIAATELWAGSLLASAEGVYNWGVAGIWMYCLPTGIAFTVFAFVARRVRYLIPNGTTVGSYMARRYNRTTHILFTCVALYIMFIFTMFQVIGGATVFSVLFKINYNTSAVVIAVVFTLYFLIAGMWSSLVTAFVQYFVVAAILLILVPYITIKTGGPSHIWAEYKAHITGAQFTNPFRKDALWGYFAQTLGGWGVIATMSNYAWQRAYAVREKEVFRGMIWGGWSWVPLAFVSSTIGVIGVSLGIKVTIGTDIFPAVVSRIVGTWGAVWLAVALLFAIYSSGAAYLGGFSSLVMADLYQPYLQKNKAVNNKRDLRLIRLISVSYGVAVAILVVALAKVSLLNTMLSTGVFISAAFFPIIAGLFWKRASSLGATLGIVGSVCTCLYLMLGTNVALTWTYIASYCISVGLTIVGSLIKPGNFDFVALRQRGEQELLEKEQAKIPTAPIPEGILATEAPEASS